VIRARSLLPPWKQGAHVEIAKGGEVHASPTIAIILAAGALVWTNRAIIGQIIDTLDGSKPPSQAGQP
jgi:hypothetical protein